MLSIEELKAMVRSYADTDCPGWRCACVVVDLGHRIPAQQLVILPLPDSTPSTLRGWLAERGDSG